MVAYRKNIFSFGLFFLFLFFLAGCAQKGDVSRVQNSSSTGSENSGGDEQIDNGEASSTTQVSWEFTGDDWRALGKPPECSQSLVLPAPVDLSRVTGILYPGQVRGGNYKPHGGFRFDGASGNSVTVRAPLEARVVRGSRYIEQGEVQYLFDFINPCGIMYRFDHLHTLSPKFQTLAEQFAPAVPDNSSTTSIQTPIFVSVGEEIATEVGFLNTKNASLDFGVYDLRTKNEPGQDVAWTEQYGKELAPHGVCWFDWLNAADEGRVRSLPPADQTSGGKSDYCK